MVIIVKEDIKKLIKISTREILGAKECMLLEHRHNKHGYPTMDMSDYSQLIDKYEDFVRYLVEIIEKDD